MDNHESCRPPTQTNPTNQLAKSFVCVQCASTPARLVSTSTLADQHTATTTTTATTPTRGPDAPRRGLGDSEKERILNLVRKRTSGDNYPGFYLGLEAVSRTLLTMAKIVTPPSVTKRFLMESNVTIFDLVETCGISVVDLKSEGVLDTFQDLVDLGFKPSDLKVNPRLFNANQLQMLFSSGPGGASMFHRVFSVGRKAGAMKPKRLLAAMAEVDFDTAELITLGFSLDVLFPASQSASAAAGVFSSFANLEIGFDGLKELGFDFECVIPARCKAPMLQKRDLANLELAEDQFFDLGLTKTMMHKLKLNFKFCKVELGWDMENAAELWGIPAWKSSYKKAK